MNNIYIDYSDYIIFVCISAMIYIILYYLRLKRLKIRLKYLLNIENIEYKRNVKFFFDKIISLSPFIFLILFYHLSFIIDFRHKPIFGNIEFVYISGWLIIVFIIISKIFEDLSIDKKINKKINNMKK